MTKEMKAKFRKIARQNELNRLDPRFGRTMAFFVRKGFLKYNRDLHVSRSSSVRCDLRDAIWAGLTVEPRILEVLPAALARLPKAFRLPLKLTPEEEVLLEFVGDLRKTTTREGSVFGISFEKCRVWMELPLNDARTQIEGRRKKMKTFRLKPEAILRLKTEAEKHQVSEAEILENLILKGEYSA